MADSYHLSGTFVAGFVAACVLPQFESLSRERFLFLRARFRASADLMRFLCPGFK